MFDHERVTILVHRDDALRRQFADAHVSLGTDCVTAGGWSEVESTLGERTIDTVLLQVPKQDGQDAIDLLTHVRHRAPRANLVIIAPQVSPMLTRGALRIAARDLILEPVNAAVLHRCLASMPAPPPATRVAAESPPRHAMTCHSAFLNGLSTLRSTCRRRSEPMSIMMLDLDRFRECNEHHSPAFGDRVLAWFECIVQRMCRRSDLVARYASDRYVVALPDSTVVLARELAQRTRQAMLDDPVCADGDPIELTVSIGIVESTVGVIETEHQLLRRVRIALEQAKREGGNRTVGWEDLVATQDERHRLDLATAYDVSHWVARTRQQVRCTYVESTRALVAAVEAKDPHTRRHSLNVATLAEEIGRRMKLSARMLETLRAAALLHDIGKIGVPDAILTKQHTLDGREFDLVKRHPATALDILGHVSFLADERPLILHHHERYDGNGYPGGVVGNRIPIGARVLSVADSLDAMFSARSYKPPYPIDRVRAELQAGAGTQFDPNVAEAALRWLDERPNAARNPEEHSITSCQ